MVLNNPLFVARNSRFGYQIEQSLRFDSADLTKSVTTTGDQTLFTWSGWVKRGALGTSQYIFGANVGASVDGGIFFDGSDVLAFSLNGNTYNKYTTAVFRDPSAWYHVVVVFNSSNATAANRIRIYVNGTEQTDYTTANSGLPPLNHNSFITLSGATQTIGELSGYATNDFSGYLAEVNFIDGSALDPTDFGELDNNGVWRPIAYTGSHGTNGFYLTFDPSATNGIGHDHSGNGNHFTGNNFTTSGTGTDVMDDTPTTNWCTLNPLTNGGTLANGNLDFSTGATHALAKSTFAIPSTGLWYAEARVTTLTSGVIAAGFGLGTAGLSLTAIASAASGAWEIYASSSRYFNRNGTQTSISGVFAAGAILQLAVDPANNRAWVGVDNTWYNGSNGTTGDPSTGSNPTFSSLPADLFVIANTYSNTLSVNFGQHAFAYTPPTGFEALNTANLPAPSIKDGSKYFDTKLYTGNGSTQTISGLGFSPDVVWLKSRSGAFNHALFDTVRTAGYQINSNLTDVETLDTTKLSAFTSDGFTLGNAGGTNGSGSTYVAWNWLAANGTSSNTDGSITSTVSANPTAGFSIVSYTGASEGSNNTVGHGLGVPPKFVIIKNRDGGQNWQVGHDAIGTDRLLLNNNIAKNSSGGFSAVPTSTVVNLLGGVNRTNINGNDFIMYCFAEVEGYSKFGSYTGNGSSDGPFVYCGLRPAWVMIKRTDSSANWQIYDTARDTSNKMFLELVPNSNAEENSISLNIAVAIDALSNGFKLRDSDTAGNASGGTFIFAAFAENPFGGSGVSPATAR